MGIGDELMAAGEARRRALAAGKLQRYGMLDKKGRPKWHFVWEGNPNIARPGEPNDGVIEYLNGRRPYIADESRERRAFRAYQPTAAHIGLNARALEIGAFCKGAVVFNPTIKASAPANKDWGLHRWKALTLRFPQYRWVQIGDPSGFPRIRGVERVFTLNFHEAAGAIAGARAVVVHEGALHHAAAALGTPAVVIRGGYISPKVTGYAGQADLYVAMPEWPDFAELGCGMRVPCRHCAQALASITPEDVGRALGKLLQERQAA
jgi:hypothetical protein